MITEVSFRSSISNKKKKQEQPLVKNYPTAVNASSHVSLVTFLTRDLQDMLQKNRELTAQVSSQLKQVENSIEFALQQIYTLVSDALVPLRQKLQDGIELQKQENSHLQSQVSVLKKQKQILQQRIFGLNKKTKNMSQQVVGINQ